MNFPVLLILFGGAISNAGASKILALLAFQTKSHFVMLEALAKGLAGKGHQVTVVSHFPQKTHVPNYEDISLSGTAENIVDNVTVAEIFENWRNPINVLNFIWERAGVNHCELTYNIPVIQDLIKTGRKFDLLITELWGSDCFLPLANIFRVPHISIITTMEVPWCLDRYGSPFNPAYQSNHFTAFSPKGMSFFERVINTVFTAYMKVGHHLKSELPSNKIVQKYLGESIPNLSDIVKESSLLFVNSHFSISGSRPFSPNIIEVGGLHIQDPKPLPEDLKKFLDEATEGAILFSLGSLIKADSLENSILDIFIEEFRRLPQNVLWKINSTFPNQPKNVKTVKWLPQSDILRHPNLKLFITHGGLMGTQEAITAGVPMLGIPFFADQRFNLNNYQEKGFAIKLEFEDINKENFRKAVHDLLHDHRFMKKAKQFSRLFTDRPRTALETAIYWTEYVLRHNGTKHLRSAGIDLSFTEYHLIDVGIFIVLVVAASAFAIVKLIQKFF